MDHLKEKNQPQGLDEIDAMLSEFTVLSADELLAGPSLSLPNMLVIRSVMGTRKTVAYVSLVIVMATLAGFIFGNWC